MSYFEANWNALRYRDYALAQKLLAVRGKPSPFRLIPGPFPNLELTWEGQRYLFYPGENPWEYDACHLENTPLGEAKRFLLYGLGLGYHLQILHQALPENTTLIVVEPSLEIFHAAMEGQDLVPLLTSSRVHWLINLSEEEAIERLGSLGRGPWEIQSTFPVDFPHLTFCHTEYFAELKNRWGRRLHSLRQNTHFIQGAGAMMTRNFLRNLPDLLLAPPLSRLQGPLASLPVFIVAAGPSLQKNIHLLRQVENRALIIAAGSAVNAMLHHGVRPHLAANIDPGHPNLHHWQGLPADLPIVYDFTADYRSVKAHRRHPRFWTFTLGKNPLVDFFHRYGFSKEKALFDTGPSVANYSLQIAKFLGCQKVYLVGQDLAYSRGQTHAPGTYHRTDLLQNPANRGTITVPGLDGQPLQALPSFIEFRDWFSAFVQKNPAMTVINCTEGGTPIPGIANRPLQWAIDELNHPPLDITAIINAVSTVPKAGGQHFATGLKALLKCADTFEAGGRDALALAQKYQELLKRYGDIAHRMEDYYRKLAKVEERIYRDKKALEFFSLAFAALVQQSQLEADLQLTEDASQRYAGDLQRNQRFFSEILRGVKEIRPAIEYTLERLPPP